MASKREEERNEKIIRGLMKLPPNRRCINCNSLGPQYVCTNFWTFICMICSGIHREFTHRVKSVSMSKFTSQEVEALQNGGNQRAREIFLKDWDLQGRRMPNSSNVDRVREFIKAVYVDRKYAGGNKSEKPPRDMQSQVHSGDDIRRASSYHSYSQSPPYDFQYEDRLKRNQGGSLTRKPGSDRGLYERKAASFIYSPGRFNDNIYEDRFGNEGSSSRVSDYSVSSGGDPFRSGPQSPNLQKDDGFSSPTVNCSREIVGGAQRQTTRTNSEAYAKRDTDRVPVPCPQRTVSTGSFESFDSNSVSIQSVDSGSLFDTFSEPNLSVATTPNKVSTFPSSSQPSTGELNLFKDPSRIPAPSSIPVTDLFQAPTTGSAASIDLFQQPADSSALSQDHHTQQTSLSSSSYFNELSHRPSVLSLNQKLPEPSEPSNEGWATFDLPQHSASIADTHDATVSAAHSEGGISSANMNYVLSSNIRVQWQDFQPSIVHGAAPLVSNSWNESLQNAHGPTSTPSSQPWKAFEEDNEQHQYVDMQQGIDLQASLTNPSSTTDQYLGLKISEGSNVDGFQSLASGEGASFPTFLSHVASGSSINKPILPFTGDIAHIAQKSVNPFDINSELEASNAFLDMSTLQAAVPSTPLSSPYVNGMDESWFLSNPVASQGGISYVTLQASNSQLQNVPTPEPVASIGGNPFA